MVEGPSIRDYAAAKAPDAAKRVDEAFEATLAKMQVMKDTADSGEMAYDQMIGAGQCGGQQDRRRTSCDGLVAQARAVEGVVAALGLTIELEGSDSLDNPAAGQYGAVTRARGAWRVRRLRRIRSAASLPLARRRRHSRPPARFAAGGSLARELPPPARCPLGDGVSDGLSRRPRSPRSGRRRFACFGGRTLAAVDLSDGRLPAGRCG